MATVGVHVGYVVFSLDVWVEVLGVLEGFGECLEFLEDSEGDSCGEVVSTVVAEVCLVDACCCNASCSIDDGVELF